VLRCRNEWHRWRRHDVDDCREFVGSFLGGSVPQTRLKVRMILSGDRWAGEPASFH
jgi:hypothetical protein